MSTLKRNRIIGSTTADDIYKTERTRDLSGGQNTRLDSQDLQPTQAVSLQNVDIGIPGKRIARPGLTLLEDTEYDELLGITPFDPRGTTNTMDLIYLSGTDLALAKSVNGGAFSKIVGSDNIVDADNPISFRVFKTGGDGDVRVFGSQTVNWHEVKQNGTVTDLGSTSGTGSDSPPKSNVGAFYNSRMWVQADDKLYYSDALPSSYANTFDTQATGQSYNMPVGEEMAIIGIREKGLIVFGKDKVRYVIPSDVPAATDFNGILVEEGCVAGRTVQIVGDDILYLARDGVRSLSKTQFDTLQNDTSTPLSYLLKDQFELINWQDIDKASAVYFDNKYFLTLPINSSDTNNSVWVYYPATKGWMIITGWEVRDWVRTDVDGKDSLYAISATDGKVYKAWDGADDNGVDIAYVEESRKYDSGTSFEKKNGGEVFLRAKATGQYQIDVYGSFDEGTYNKLGELTTDDRRTNFAAWTLPMIFQGDGLYDKKFHFDTYGPWYQMQVKLEATDNFGEDLSILETSIITRQDKYISEESDQ